MRLCLVLLRIPLCLSAPRSKKFNNIVRNNHRHTQGCEFLVLVRKHPFWANLARKIKIVSLSWNLVPRPIRICRIQWWCSLFPFLTENTFFVHIWSKNLRLSLWAEIWYLDYFEYAQFNGDAEVFCFRPKIPFLGNLFQKNKTVSLRWSLVPWLIRICIIQWWCSLLEQKYPF